MVRELASVPVTARVTNFICEALLVNAAVDLQLAAILFRDDGAYLRMVFTRLTT